jgi:AraC family transcriptional regulator
MATRLEARTRTLRAATRNVRDTSCMGAVVSSTVRMLAAGRGWRVSDVRCERGPRDKPYEEQHGSVSLGAVLSGTFRYRGSTGDALLYPGAVLLGAPGACFECGHEHGVGDHCLALQFDPEAFDELAASVSGDPRFRLRRPMLPAVRDTLAPLQRLQTRLAANQGVEEAALQFAETVVCALSEGSPETRPISPRGQRRIAAVARHMETHSHEALELETLAALACMSKYHFLRCFRRTLGCTPHQWLLQQRLRRAARALQHEPDAAVAAIALDAGFGDLSTFNALFRSVFGATPGEFRRVG